MEQVHVEAVDVEQQNIKPTWQTPVVTSLDIKRTLLASGVGTDGGFVSP